MENPTTDLAHQSARAKPSHPSKGVLVDDNRERQGRVREDLTSRRSNCMIFLVDESTRSLFGLCDGIHKWRGRGTHCSTATRHGIQGVPFCA